eukprot:COSAG02_NODE_55156_length_292_cov_0.761658_1_plen_76_part_10
MAESLRAQFPSIDVEARSLTSGSAYRLRLCVAIRKSPSQPLHVQVIDIVYRANRHDMSATIAKLCEMTAERVVNLP